jgi:putative Ca2+/H+ antiporter (TMEM165/GDT1 family)
MISLSEIGDKTFIITLIMALHSRPSVIFGAATSALTLMTFLSALFGYFFPKLLSKDMVRSVYFVFLAQNWSMKVFGLSKQKRPPSNIPRWPWSSRAKRKKSLIIKAQRLLNAWKKVGSYKKQNGTLTRAAIDGYGNFFVSEAPE